MDREDLGVGFLVLLLEKALRRIVSEAAGVDAHHVDRGLAFDDPFGELPARATRGRDPEGMALVEPEVGHQRRRPDDRRTVGRVRDGAVIDLLDPDLAEGRHALDRRLDIGHQPVEIFLEQLVFAVRRRAVHIADRRAFLVGAEQQAACLLAHVPGTVGFAQHAHFGQALALALLDRRMRFSHDILVLDRNDRHLQPDHAAGLAREIAARRYDMLADDVAGIRLDPPLAAAGPLDRGHGGVAVDLAPAIACAAGQGLGQVGGLDVAVLRVLDGAEQPFGIAQRPDLADLVRRQCLDLDPANRGGDAGIVLILVHPVLGAGETDVGDLAEAGVEPRLLLQPLVERHGIFVDLADRIADVEEGQQAGRVPGRTGGELLALNQHAIGPAFLDQVIERRHAHDAAADHHHSRMRPHLGSSCQFRAKLGCDFQGTHHRSLLIARLHLSRKRRLPACLSGLSRIGPSA